MPDRHWNCVGILHVQIQTTLHVSCLEVVVAGNTYGKVSQLYLHTPQLSVVHTHFMYERAAGFETSVLSWVESGRAIEKQQSSKLVVWMYVCMYYIAWSELTSVFQCTAENFDEILCSWKKKPFNLAEHLSMKEGSLFCFVVMRSTEPGRLRSCSWRLWKALDEEGMHLAWFHDIWTCYESETISASFYICWVPTWTRLHESLTSFLQNFSKYMDGNSQKPFEEDLLRLSTI